MKILMLAAAVLTLASASTAFAQADEPSFAERWQDRVEVPLPRERPSCNALDPAFCNKLKPILQTQTWILNVNVANRQADNMDEELTGYGFPWINVRSMNPWQLGNPDYRIIWDN